MYFPFLHSSFSSQSLEGSFHGEGWLSNRFDNAIIWVCLYPVESVISLFSVNFTHQISFLHCVVLSTLREILLNSYNFSFSFTEYNYFPIPTLKKECKYSLMDDLNIKFCELLEKKSPYIHQIKFCTKHSFLKYCFLLYLSLSQFLIFFLCRSFDLWQVGISAEFNKVFKKLFQIQSEKF